MKKILMLLVIAMMACMAANAQKYEKVPRKWDTWLGASIGITHSFAENATSDEFFHNYPGLEGQLGTFFNRFVGARLSLGFNPQLARPGEAQRVGDPDKYDTFYRFYVLSGYADLMLDLTNIFARRKYRPTFDILLFAGGGGLECFHYDLKVRDWEYYPVDYYDKTRWGAHAGLMASYRFSPHWDFTVESSYNIAPSDYDGVKGHVYLSGYLKAHAGFVYHIYESKTHNVRLTTDVNSGWTPSYTEKDRKDAKALQHKRLEDARKQSAKRRAQHAKIVKERNEKAEKARREAEKTKAKKAKARQAARLYNEQ